MATHTFLFDEAAHVYRMENGLRVPSTTQVLKRAGLVSFDQVAEDVLERKSALGTAVHACTQYLDEGDLDYDTLQPEWLPYVSAWDRFKAESEVKLLAIEERRVADVNGMFYGMTFDRLAIVTGRESVLDIKTSASKSAWWGDQLASYDLGLPPCTSQERRDRYAVQLKPDGSYRLWPFTDPIDYDAWTWALALTWVMLNRGYQID